MRRTGLRRVEDGVCIASACSRKARVLVCVASKADGGIDVCDEVPYGCIPRTGGHVVTAAVSTNRRLVREEGGHVCIVCAVAIVVVYRGDGREEA